MDAGPHIAERIQAGHNAGLYADGLRLAREFASTMPGSAFADLTPAEVHALLERLRAEAPGFFKQLRMDVVALYLSDPVVLQRIGFPGAAIEHGGYPDFDRPPDSRR